MEWEGVNIKSYKMFCTIRVGRWVRCDDTYFNTNIYPLKQRPWDLTGMFIHCLLRKFCCLKWQGRNQRRYPHIRGRKLGQETKQFALGDPLKQSVSRDYLTDFLNPSQTFQPLKLFLKLFSHLAMLYNLDLIGQGQEKEWRTRQISLISVSCLHPAKGKAFPIFDFQTIVCDFPLFFPKNIFLFLPPSRLHPSCFLSLYGSFGCVATARSLKKGLAGYKWLNEKSELCKVLTRP